MFFCVSLFAFCARISDGPLCFSARCSATPHPSQGQKSSHLIVSSTSSGVQKHSLSEGKLETKSSEELREGCNRKPIRFDSQILKGKLLKPSKISGAKTHTCCVGRPPGVRRRTPLGFALPWRLKAENTTDVSTSAVATKFSHLAFLLLSRSLVLQA